MRKKSRKKRVKSEEKTLFIRKKLKNVKKSVKNRSPLRCSTTIFLTIAIIGAFAILVVCVRLDRKKHNRNDESSISDIMEQYDIKRHNNITKVPARDLMTEIHKQKQLELTKQLDSNRRDKKQRPRVVGEYNLKKLN